MLFRYNHNLWLSKLSSALCCNNIISQHLLLICDQNNCQGEVYVQSYNVFANNTSLHPCYPRPPASYLIHVCGGCRFTLMNLLFSQIYDTCICSEHPRVNGPISELMSPLDDLILDFMTEQDIPGASLALSKDGKLLYCQGDVIWLRRNCICEHAKLVTWGTNNI